MDDWGVPDPDVESELIAIQEAIATVAGSSLVGLYLFGSLATGEFDAGVSDIDLMAVLADPPDEELARRLGRMHDDLARASPEWDGRIEVIYVSAGGLAHCRTDPTEIAVISPGEPFHVVEAGRDWILNWYPARESALTLMGPMIDSLIPPIPTVEYVEEVRKYVVGYISRITDDAWPGSQAYAILAMCRGLHTIRFGDRLSKKKAAVWAQEEFPDWAGLIRRALTWRQRQWAPDRRDGRATVQETRAFLAAMTKVALD